MGNFKQEDSMTSAYKNMESAGDLQVKIDAIHQVRAAFRPCKTLTQCRQPLDCTTAAGLCDMKQKQGEKKGADRFDVPRRDVQERNMCLYTISVSSRNATNAAGLYSLQKLGVTGKKRLKKSSRRFPNNSFSY